MKKEDEELLLKDLSARLPYKPWVWFKENWETNPNFKGCQSQLRLYYLEFIVKDMDITLKPYLRPISSMTKEEKKELSARWLWTRCFDNINLAYLCDSAKDYVACSSGEYFELQDWLNAHHFDYRGLIPKGLAIEAPKDMYNEIEEEKK